MEPRCQRLDLTRENMEITHQILVQHIWLISHKKTSQKVKGPCHLEQDRRQFQIDDGQTFSLEKLELWKDAQTGPASYTNHQKIRATNMARVSLIMQTKCQFRVKLDQLHLESPEGDDRHAEDEGCEGDQGNHQKPVETTKNKWKP